MSYQDSVDNNFSNFYSKNYLKQFFPVPEVLCDSIIEWLPCIDEATSLILLTCIVRDPGLCWSDPWCKIPQYFTPYMITCVNPAH